MAEGLLDPRCEQIFRVKTHAGDVGREPIVFHQHQRDAIVAARTGGSYVLTTGIGSGKSLGYIVPIVDRVLWERATAGSGVKAIVVYPMNALASSQVEELRKFLEVPYVDLAEIAADADTWAGTHCALAGASAALREELPVSPWTSSAGCWPLTWTA